MTIDMINIEHLDKTVEILRKEEILENYTPSDLVRFALFFLLSGYTTEDDYYWDVVKQLALIFYRD